MNGEMFDTCPETFCGLGSHAYTEWEVYRSWETDDGLTVWKTRKCKRCGRSEWKRTRRKRKKTKYTL